MIYGVALPSSEGWGWVPTGPGPVEVPRGSQGWGHCGGCRWARPRVCSMLHGSASSTSKISPWQGADLLSCTSLWHFSKHPALNHPKKPLAPELGSLLSQGLGEHTHQHRAPLGCQRASGKKKKKEGQGEHRWVFGNICKLHLPLKSRCVVLPAPPGPGS